MAAGILLIFITMITLITVIDVRETVGKVKVRPCYACRMSLRLASSSDQPETLIRCATCGADNFISLEDPAIVAERLQRELTPSDTEPELERERGT